MELITSRIMRSPLIKVAAGMAMLLLGAYTIEAEPFGLHQTDDLVSTEATPQPTQADILGLLEVGIGAGVVAAALRDKRPTHEG